MKSGKSASWYCHFSDGELPVDPFHMSEMVVLGEAFEVLTK
jgi:hypothetical protein